MRIALVTLALACILSPARAQTADPKPTDVKPTDARALKTYETAVQLLRERMERVQFSGRRGWISGGHRGGDRAGVRGAARLGAERLWTCVGVEFAGGRRGIFVLQFSAGENIYEGFREHGAGVQRGISGLGFR
jgi:hypothetical protein